MGDSRKKLSRRERNQAERSSHTSTSSTYIQATQLQFHQTSLVPMAEELARLEQITPGLAERAFAMAERQQEHRHGLESAVVIAGIKRASRGQWFAFLLCAGAIGGGIYLSSIGQTTKGVVAIIGALVALITVFLHAKRSGRSEMEKKDPAKASRR